MMMYAMDVSILTNWMPVIGGGVQNIKELIVILSALKPSQKMKLSRFSNSAFKFFKLEITKYIFSQPTKNNIRENYGSH